MTLFLAATAMSMESLKQKQATVYQDLQNKEQLVNYVTQVMKGRGTFCQNNPDVRYPARLKLGDIAKILKEKGHRDLTTVFHAYFILVLGNGYDCYQYSEDAEQMIRIWWRNLTRTYKAANTPYNLLPQIYKEKAQEMREINYGFIKEIVEEPKLEVILEKLLKVHKEKGIQIPDSLLLANHLSGIYDAYSIFEKHAINNFSLVYNEFPVDKDDEGMFSINNIGCIKLKDFSERVKKLNKLYE